MKRPILQKLSSFFLITGCLLLTLLLAACNMEGNTIKAAKIKPTPIALTTYQGDGYTIGYPQGWSAKGKGSFVTFTDPQGLTAFLIEETANPDGVIPPTIAVDGGLNGLKVRGTNFQKADVAPTLMLGGTTWYQGQAVADTTTNGQTTNLKLVVLSSNYPQRTISTRTFTLIYSTPIKEFDKINSQSFQPMLQSFKFV
jgi:hypothetical protein